MRRVAESVLFEVKTCREAAHVIRLSLESTRGENEEIWAIERQLDEPVSAFRLGTVPESFVEVTPLGAGLSGDGDYLVVADLSEEVNHLATEFRLDELGRGAWKINAGRELSEDEFEAYDPC